MSIDEHDEDDLNESFEEAVEDEALEVASAASGSGGGEAPRALDEDAELRTVSSRQQLRDEVEDEIERFLASGGKITVLEPELSADPPRRPSTNYGGRPI